MVRTIEIRRAKGAKRKIVGIVRVAGSIFCAKNLRSFRGELASRVRLLKSKIKSLLMTALNVLKGVNFERR